MKAKIIGWELSNNEVTNYKTVELTYEVSDCKYELLYTAEEVVAKKIYQNANNGLIMWNIYQIKQDIHKAYPLQLDDVDTSLFQKKGLVYCGKKEA
jgi:hypothetical protein